MGSRKICSALELAVQKFRSAVQPEHVKSPGSLEYDLHNLFSCISFYNTVFFSAEEFQSVKLRS